ncbi:MAG TPA: Os1348 family NHLP clan protein [Candidatus Thermoplasmatota archaeon]|nr:Os1348 family NHLP clan protein [Candidatus Thermoplasmatota archaeon]
MTLAQAQAVVARLLAEPGFLVRFRQDPERVLRDFDLTPEEAAALLRLDLARIGMVCEGYAGKRAERVESAFPWTLRALGAEATPLVRAHLAAFPAGREEAEELAAFAQRVRDHPLPAWRARLAHDLLDAEAALRAQAPGPGPSEARWSGGLRVRLAPGLARLRARGDLAGALAAGGWTDYAERPTDVLVRATPRGPRAEALAAEDARLLDAVASGATVAEAARTPEAEARLRRWYAAGILVASQS